MAICAGDESFPDHMLGGGQSIETTVLTTFWKQIRVAVQSLHCSHHDPQSGGLESTGRIQAR